MRLYKMKYKAKEEWALEDMKKEQIEASYRRLKILKCEVLKKWKTNWCLVHLYNL